VNFWAPGADLVAGDPAAQQAAPRSRAQKLEIIGIAVDFREDVLKYAKATTISYPLLIGEDEGLAAVKAMGMQPQFPSPCLPTASSASSRSRSGSCIRMMPT
jgi:hypothetical protein